MLSDLLFALRRFRWDQLKYWRHTYSPFSPWRQQMAEAVEMLTTEATRYGVQAELDPRRVYQVARGVVANRHGEHLVDLVPDAYLAFSPPSAATYHAGKRSYEAPDRRRRMLLQHPQTLAYVLTQPRLSRLGVGGSGPHGLSVIGADDTGLDTDAVLGRLRELTGGRGGDADLRAYADVLVRLRAGIPREHAGTGEQAA